MIYQVFAVFDAKVGAYMAPFHLRSRGEAIRSFEDACRDDKLPFKSHPADYRLCYLCEYDDVDGVFSGGPPVVVIGADELGTSLPRSGNGASVPSLGLPPS